MNRMDIAKMLGVISITNVTLQEIDIEDESVAKLKEKFQENMLEIKNELLEMAERSK